MKKTLILVGIIIGIVVIGIGVAYAVCINACYPTNKNSVMGSMMRSGMMSGMMMDDVPHDVIIKVVSSQKVPIGKEAQIKLLILDKNTKQPLNDAQVIVGIERGAPMSTMMMNGMFKADNIGNGKYVIRFTVNNSGYYTMHTHVIPNGKSMHSMMNNHMDIGIIAA